ncbi:hypothetical protein AYI92_03345 [Shewanella xiamenensis]|uniref:hypothetical protein n=1 Tax=Shewanella xiamenensis TaxID=332186 RepID=UPI001643450B|nr:hypothetical protein [Shewanella xiamenensis]TVL22787.1 hypothetical protein AYI90_03715 [Shewanella xiamenensis]TVL23062.1 hypothetical protein AYI91_04675 [Shewanella xiamenensis]TVL28483.1 hypothetical protein AYI92_03345 [Shewanella xiamenensis]TVL36990.1 hypothetical protein AYI93_04080 [Shewanella xiamenensis]TVP04640.1 hypothetical protein AYI89_04075 [Shewanella xiamenensis]
MMTLNDRMNLLIAENEQLKAEVAELKDQVSILSQRPKYDLSTTQGREQSVIERLKIQGLVSNKAGAS